jgi:hypothetical protein
MGMGLLHIITFENGVFVVPILVECLAPTDREGADQWHQSRLQPQISPISQDLGHSTLTHASYDFYTYSNDSESAPI